MSKKKPKRNTLKELVVRVWRESMDDDVFGGAAKLAYYFLLALFPLLIFLTSLIGFIPDAQSSLINGVARVAPPDALKLVRETLDDIVSHRSGSLISFALVGALWAASSGVSSLIDTLNTAYDATETRPLWKRRLIALGLTLALAIMVMSGSMLVMVGHRVGNWFERAMGFSGALAFISTVLGYLVGFGLLLAGIIALYYFGPDIKRGEKPVKPGAVFAAIGIVIGSVMFSLYLRVAPAASATYGSLGAVITLMLWLYLMGLVLLVGGEINSEVA